MKPTFENTVDILVKAYLNDTLEPGNYCACAVGNLMAHAVNAEIYLNDKRACSKYAWRHPEFNGGEWYTSRKSIEGKALIQSTGYSDNEIWMIERAFEKKRRNSSTENDDIMFDGLMAVIDVLAEIHGVDLTQKEQAKLLFQK